MKQTDMKWFECRAEKVEMIYQLIEAENAQEAERQFRDRRKCLILLEKINLKL
jgi:hypothetical protein